MHETRGSLALLALGGGEPSVNLDTIEVGGPGCKRMLSGQQTPVSAAPLPLLIIGCSQMRSPQSGPILGQYMVACIRPVCAM